MNVPPLSEDKISTDGKSNFQTAFERLKTNNALFLIILLGLLIIVFGGYLIWLNQNTVPSENKRFRDEPVPTITPIPSITPSITPIPPTPTDLPVANISSLKGKLIYKNGNSIIISDVDGSNQALLLKSDNPKFQFAGWSDEGKVFYYAEEVKNKGIVYKKDLSTGKVTQLFTFNTLDSRVPDEYEYEQLLQVTVRKDGKFALYIHNGADLSLFDITNKTSKKLLTYNPCWGGGDHECGPTEKYYTFSSPSWSPDGTMFFAIKGVYERSLTIIMNPFIGNLKQEITDIGGDCRSHWSKDSKMLLSACAGMALGEGRLNISTNFLDNPITKNVLSDKADFKKDRGNAIISAVFSDNGKVAFIYETLEKKGFAFYDINDDSIKYLAGLPRNKTTYEIIDWLPDSESLLYRANDSVENTNGGEPELSGILWELDTVTLMQKQLPIKTEEGVWLVQ